MDLKDVIVIFGPTASGKTKLSIELAKRINGEIVSCDSMQIYKYLNIGTAKPSIEEQSGIKHYLIDEIEPDVNFSVKQYKDLALKYIANIIENGKVPIVVGGTGLYLNALIYNINYAQINNNLDYRKKLKELAIEKGSEFLHEWLKKVDNHAANKIHMNDEKRIIRALEVYESTQNTISNLQLNSRNVEPLYNFINFQIVLDRNKLYDRINNRVNEMIKNGLIEETKKIIELGYYKSCTSMQAIAYKETFEYLIGHKSIEEVIELLQKSTRRYAKRQITWFKRIENSTLIDISEDFDLEVITNKIKK